mgnify:CR=1 FL=1
MQTLEKERAAALTEPVDRQRFDLALGRGGVDGIENGWRVDRFVGVEEDGCLGVDPVARKDRGFRANRVIDVSLAVGRRKVGGQETGQRVDGGLAGFRIDDRFSQITLNQYLKRVLNRFHTVFK